VIRIRGTSEERRNECVSFRKYDGRDDFGDSTMKEIWVNLDRKREQWSLIATVVMAVLVP
jgi:hypothetical protein